MPAYSYQERFIPMLLDGSKTWTIRDRRRYLPREGQRIYHYFGLRTAFCKRLLVSNCAGARSLSISQTHGIVLYSKLLSYDELEVAKWIPTHENLPGPWSVFNARLRDVFAWKDGFRPARSTEAYPRGAYDLMIRYYLAADRIPWAGDIIYW